MLQLNKPNDFNSSNMYVFVTHQISSYQTGSRQGQELYSKRNQRDNEHQNPCGYLRGKRSLDKQNIN